MENTNNNTNQNNGGGTNEKVVLPVGDDTNVINNDNNQTNNNSNNTDSQNASQNQTNQNSTNQTENQTQQTNQNSQTEISTIEIDGKDYNLDKDGNAIDSTGNVVMSKSQIDEAVKGQNNNQDNNNSLVSQIEKITNIIVNDEAGKPIVYSPTPEGLAKRELDIINATRISAQQEGVNNFLESNPEFKSMYQYKQLRGTLEGYGKETDYTSITIDKNNKEQLKNFIIEEQLSKGTTLQIAKGFADFAEKNNTLGDLGEAAFNNLKNAQIEIAQAKQKQFKDWADKYYGVELDDKGNTKDLKVSGSLYDMIVTKGEFNGLKIPKDGVVVKNNDGTTTKLNNKQLFELMAYSDNNGATKADNIIADYLRNAGNKIAITLYILKGGDLSELANAAVARNQANKIKISTQNNRSTSRSFEGNSSNSSKENVVIPVR